MTTQFKNVSVDAKANIYFDGKVVSHTFWMENGDKKTAGIVFPGSFHFSTSDPERMDIISGTCQVKLADSDRWQTIPAGEGFDVPGKSSFDISCDAVCEYICTFVKS